MPTAELESVDAAFAGAAVQFVGHGRPEVQDVFVRGDGLLQPRVGLLGDGQPVQSGGFAECGARGSGD